MKYLKTYEDIKDKEYWNKVLYDATWRTDRKGKRIPYDENFINFDGVKLAIENGADVESANTLYWAVRMSDLKTVKYMVEHGANINYQDNDTKWTPIMSAVGSNNDHPINLDLCLFLLDNGADPTIGNFQNINTMDLLSHTKMRNFTPAYPMVDDKEKEKMDIIYKYIIDNILEKEPYKAIEYKEYLTPEQKVQFAPYLDAEKYNL